jgi:hypothetical protein
LDDKKRGGHNKETILLTINAFKRFCLKADTKKADQIHEYYIKLEETLHEIINEESNELRLQLEEVKTRMIQTEQYNANVIEKLQKERALEKQTILLREFGVAGALVYIVKVKSYDNGQYVIKIGESRRGIEGRYNEHKSKYEEAILLDCFLVKRSKDFESFLHSHKDIRLNRVTDLEGHENENELFLIGRNLSYGILTNVIKSNIKLFNDVDYDKISTDIDIMKNILMNNKQEHEIDGEKNTINQIVENQKIMIRKMDILERKVQEILDKPSTSQTRTMTQFGTPIPTLGPRLQKIHPETLQVVKTYETVTECMRENAKMKRPSIHKAIQENTVYNGFRWIYLDRNLDPHTIINIQPTKQTRPQSIGYIAKLNAMKTEIINVYLDRKTAAVNNGYSHSGLDTPVKNGSITNNHYYVLYDKCDASLIQKFKEEHGAPLLYKYGVGQYDESHQLVHEFACKYDAIRTLRISDKTLSKALDNNLMYGGHYYKNLGQKLSCIP